MRKLLMLVLPVFAACGVDVAAEREALIETDREFAEMSVKDGAVDAFTHYLAAEAIQLPHRRGPVNGRDAIREEMLKGPQYELSWEPVAAEVAASGDFGYTWGYYVVRFPGRADNARGKYLNVWRKQADGNWRVLIDMGNEGPAEE